VLRTSKRLEPVNLVHCPSCDRHEPFCYSRWHRPTPKNTLRGNPGCAVGPKTPTHKEESSSSTKSHRRGDKKKKMKKVVYYETDSSSPSTSSSESSVASKRHERKKYSKMPLRYPRISKRAPLLSVPLGKPPYFDGEDYCMWSDKMRHHLTSLHESIWDIVEFGAQVLLGAFVFRRSSKTWFNNVFQV
jgi:hypothetical protein